MLLEHVIFAGKFAPAVQASCSLGAAQLSTAPGRHKSTWETRTLLSRWKSYLLIAYFSVPTSKTCALCLQGALQGPQGPRWRARWRARRQGQGAREGAARAGEGAGAGERTRAAALQRARAAAGPATQATLAGGYWCCAGVVRRAGGQQLAGFRQLEGWARPFPAHLAAVWQTTSAPWV